MSCFTGIISSIVYVFRRIVHGPNGTYYTNEPDLPEDMYRSICEKCAEKEFIAYCRTHPVLLH